jgi:hypothetical protein
VDLDFGILVVEIVIDFTPHHFPILHTVLSATLVSLLASGCASSLILDPGAARKAVRFQPVKAEYPLQPQNIEVINESGRNLKGLLFSKPGDRGIVLVGGGNAMGLQHTAHYASFLLHKGFRVLVYSYQGFDENEGPASIGSLVSDARAFYNFARQTYQSEKVILFGVSISGATSVCLAQSVSPPPSVIAESIIDPKTIIKNIAKKNWQLAPVGFPIAWISSLGVPDSLDSGKCIETLGKNLSPPALLLVFNQNDELAPHSTVKKFVDEYKGPVSTIIPKCNLSGGCHMNLYCDKTSRDSIIEFIKNLLALD